PNRSDAPSYIESSPTRRSSDLMRRAIMPTSLEDQWKHGGVPKAGTFPLHAPANVITECANDNPALFLCMTVEKLAQPLALGSAVDRKSTRLNSSHVKTSYAVFC